jgi:cyclopropane fatty-acyl-phospholipid synthase-like methyltransferase
MKDYYEDNFQTWNKLATAYQERFMDDDLYNDTYDRFCELIQKTNASVFEIGCGPGNLTKYLLAQRPDFKIEAIDVAPNMIALAKQNNPAADCKVMDCREIGKLDSKYDAIICGFCLPYLTKDDCAKLISDASLLLNEGGIFYLSAIEDDYEKSGFETSSDGQNKLFVYYHKENFLREELHANGFSRIETMRKSFSKKDGSVQTHLILIAQKK